MSTPPPPDFNPTLCANLYNRIIRIGYTGSQRSQRNETLHTNYFSAWESDPRVSPCLPEWRETLPPPITSFLEQIQLVVDENGVPPLNNALVYHLESISPPSRLYPPDLVGIDPDDTIHLFNNNLFSMPECVGIVLRFSDFHVCHIRSEESFSAAEARWYPLRELLSRLLAIIQVGKYIPVPKGTASHDPWQSKNNFWDIAPWTEPILQQTLDAYHALVDAITTRLPSHHPNPQEPPSLATEATLSSEITGFPRAFLLKARKPPFKYIAPGLKTYDTTNPPPQIPTTMTLSSPPAEFNTPYRDLNHAPAYFPALILFPTSQESNQEQDSTGLYILPDMSWADTVTLVLPYELRSFPRYDGKRIPVSTRTELWQSPDCPFYVDHATRLGCLLGRWRELVEGGGLGG